MAFPEDPLGLNVDIKAGVWTDITADCKTDDPIVHTRGIRNNGTTADYATVPIKINNAGGKYSPRNPVSPYYGLIGRNTPVRLWLPGGGHFLDLDGSATSYASTPDTAALDIVGDLDLRWEGETSWYAAGAHTLVGKWDAAGNQRSYLMRLQDGQLYLSYAVDGTSTNSYFHRRPLPALPRRAALRTTLDVDNGAGGRTVRFYWAASLAGPWTEFATPTTLTGTTSVFASTAPLLAAPTDLTQSVPRYPAEGRTYAIEVRSGIAGTVVAAPNFEAQPTGTAGFTDSAGRAWSYSGTAAIADRQERFVGEIASWPQKWVPSGGLVWTPVTASGILRRYGQGAKALDSTLRRRIPSGSPLAYWPFEEDRDASRAYSPITGVQPAAVTGVEWAATDTLPSSEALPRLTAAATLSAIVPASTGGAYQVEFVYNADDKAPDAAGDFAEVFAVSTTGTVRRWWVGMKSGLTWIRGFNSGGTDIINTFVSVGGDVFHGWTRLQLWCQDQGSGNMGWRLNFQDVGGDAGGFGGVITAAAGHVTAVTANWGPLTEGWSFGHLSVVPTAVSTLYAGSDAAYSGETAWERILRLSTEENIPIGRVAGELTPQRVGPQRPATLVSLVQAAADADGGMLVEDAMRPGLVYRDRSSLYTQEPALTLAYGAPGLAPPLEPVDDDSASRNDVTVSRDGGSSARAVLTEGPLSVQAPPDGIGVYDDSQTLSLADDTQPEPIAYWQLHLGTYDGARYPSVRVLLHKAPALIPAVLALREGDLIRLTGLPPWVAYGDVDLIVTGWTETMLPRTWEITFTCLPGGPWNVAVADHPVYGKAGTDASSLALPVSDSATSLTVFSEGLPWTTDPAEMPILIDVGGEEATATAIAPLADAFDRTASSSWGTSAVGLVWSTSGGSASDYAVASGAGKHTMSSVNVSRRSILTAIAADFDLTVDMAVSATSTGGFQSAALTARGIDGNNLYTARLAFETTGTITLTLRKRVGGTETQLATLATGLTYTAGTVARLRFQGVGTQLSARAWLAAGAEPAAWQVQATDGDLTAAGTVGVRSILSSSNTNVSPVVSYDNFTFVGMQSFTVVRSANGVIKAHLAGDAVALARPAIASL